MKLNTKRRQYQHLPKVVLFIVLLMGGFLLVHIRQPTSNSEFLKPLPQDPTIQVYFNHNQASSYEDPYRHIKRQGDNLEQHIIDAINEAQSTVDLAVMQFRLPNVAKALIAKHASGVKVRVLIDNQYNKTLADYTPEAIAKMNQHDKSAFEELKRYPADAIALLRESGIEIRDDTAGGTTKGSGLMHHKFIVVDGQTTLVSSSNLTTSDSHGDFVAPETRGNANNLLKIESFELADLFTEEFNMMWGNGAASQGHFGLKKTARPVKQVTVGNTTVAVHFSPTSATQLWTESSNGLIAKTLDTATQSVNLALFVFSEQRLADVLQTSHQQGVQVKALIAPSFAYRYYSEGLDLMGVALSNKCQYEANNRPWQEALATVGIPQLPKGDVLHHKFAIVDEQIVITGSHNWSEAANTKNDETLLVINSSVVTAHYQREFERLYANAVLGIPKKLQQKIQTQENECPQITQATEPNTFTGQLVNLNTASQAELESLPGVGPKLATEIIATRQQKLFTSLDDLDQVSGVGPSLLQKLEGRITW